MNNVPSEGLQKVGFLARVSVGRVLARLASPKLTVLTFLWLAAGALWIAEGGDATHAMLGPLVLLTVNLCAALVVVPKLKSDPFLLVFHLALLALLALVTVARLTYMEGQVTLTRGVPFDGQYEKIEFGPWHGEHWARLRFTNDRVVDEFPANGDEYRTYNRVRWRDPSGTAREADIGDDRVLEIEGYRIYARYRGFAPLLLWEHPDGAIEYVSVQLGRIEPDGWHGGKTWQLPGGPEVWMGLDHRFERPARGATLIDLGSAQIASPLVVRIGDERNSLAPGATLRFPSGGALTYVRLDAWMSYRIAYQALTPWMVAACLMAAASLIGFYSRRVFRSAAPKEAQ